MTDQADALHSLAEWRAWEQRYDRGIPPRLVLPEPPIEERIAALRKVIAEHEQKRDGCLAEAAARREAGVVGWRADRCEVRADFYADLVEIDRDALRKLEADQARSLVASQTAIAKQGSDV